MKKLLWCHFVVIAWLSSPIALGQGDSECPIDVPRAHHLLTVQQATTEVLILKCADSSKTTMLLAYHDFLNQISNWFFAYGGFRDDARPVKRIKSLITNSKIETVAVALNLNDQLAIEGKSYSVESKAKCDAQANANSEGSSCVDVIEEFITLYTLAQNAYESIIARKVIVEISALRMRWEPFLEQMHGQTSLELLVNGALYRNKFSTNFEEPPNKQLILLHPMLLVENVDRAIDGENTQEALGVEIVGMNWWQRDEWYIPSGGSILTVYSDRGSVNDWGYGVALHFKSVYTLGYTNHGGDYGFFVSMDLLKLFQEKSAALEAYTGK